MPKYKLCPRCELNYIPEDEQYCGVCKAELKIGPQLQFAIDDDDEASEKLCPICKINYIPINQDVCDSCRQKQDYAEEKDVEIDDEKDESWKEFLDDDEKDEIIDKEHGEELISLTQLEQEEAAQLFDDEEDYLDEARQCHDGATGGVPLPDLAIHPLARICRHRRCL